MKLGPKKRQRTIQLSFLPINIKKLAIFVVFDVNEYSNILLININHRAGQGSSNRLHKENKVITNER